MHRFASESNSENQVKGKDHKKDDRPLHMCWEMETPGLRDTHQSGCLTKDSLVHRGQPGRESVCAKLFSATHCEGGFPPPLAVETSESLSRERRSVFRTREEIRLGFSGQTLDPLAIGNIIAEPSSPESSMSPFVHDHPCNYPDASIRNKLSVQEASVQLRVVCLAAAGHNEDPCERLNTRPLTPRLDLANQRHGVPDFRYSRRRSFIGNQIDHLDESNTFAW